MSKLRIKDAPILPDVDGSEKIPTGGRGDYAVTVDQIKTFARGELPQQLEDHINDTNNPHQVTKDQVGLGEVDNTSDIDKPISTATQEALDLKANTVDVDNALNLKADIEDVDSALTLKADKTYVDSQDLLKADKTYVDSALTLKANSVDVENSLSLKLNTSEKGQSGGLATLDDSGKVPRDELPSFVDLTSTVPMFNTPADGVDPVTGVVDGAYFNVRSEDDDTVAIEYQNIGGVATLTGKSYLSSAAINNISHNNLKDRDTAEAHPDSAIRTWSGRTQEDKNKDYISSADFAIESSTTVDQTAKLKAMLDLALLTGSKIRFEKSLDLLLTENVELYAGISIDFNNSTLHVLNTKGTTDISAPLTFAGSAKYENLKIRVDNASKFRRLMYAFDNSLFENTLIYADSEFILDKINSIDSGIMLRGSNIHFENFTSYNIDRLFRVYTTDNSTLNNISFKKIRVKNYTTGIIFTNVSTITIEDASFDTIASSAATTPGNNAILGGGLCNDVTINQIFINESGEHGIYLNDDAGSGAFSGLKMSNVMVKKSGQCGVKIRRLTDIQVSDIYTQDAAFNNSTGQNEDGVRLELCDRGIVSNIRSFTKEKGNSCNVGVIIDSCTNLTVDGVHTDKTKFAGVQISDTYLTALDNLVLKNIYSHNSDQYGLYVNTPNTVLSSFKALGLTVMNASADPVYWNTTGGSTGTHYIELYTDKETSNFVNNVNSDTKLLVQKTYVGRNSLYGDDRYRFGTISTVNFDPTISGRSALTVSSFGQTDTANSYAAAMSFYRSSRRKAAISLYQITASSAQQGLAFFTTNSTTAATDTVYLSAKLNQTAFTGGIDNTSSLGEASTRWKDIYSASSVIQTSDARHKQDVEELNEVEKRVAIACKSLIRKYRFKDAVAEKDADARLHIGVIAQEVKEAFESEGLNPFNYGIVCYDEWEADGNIEAGSRYSIRYDELAMFILSAI